MLELNDTARRKVLVRTVGRICSRGRRSCCEWQGEGEQEYGGENEGCWNAFQVELPDG